MPLPTLRHRDVIGMLENKLGIRLSQKSGDMKGTLVIDGKKITRVSLPSRHRKELGSAATRHLMARLFVTTAQLQALVDCSMSVSDYHRHLEDAGYLRDR